MNNQKLKYRRGYLNSLKVRYLDLKFGTIKTDLPKFREAIPRLDDLLNFEGDTKSLSEIIDKIKKVVENSSDLNIYENIEPLYSSESRAYHGPSYEPKNLTPLLKKFRDNSRQIHGMKVEIDKLRHRNKRYGLYEYTIDSGHFYRPENSNRFHGRDDKITGKITVYICAVCADMFSRASLAAYEVIPSRC